MKAAKKSKTRSFNLIWDPEITTKPMAAVVISIVYQQRDRPAASAKLWCTHAVGLLALGLAHRLAISPNHAVAVAVMVASQLLQTAVFDAKGRKTKSSNP